MRVEVYNERFDTPFEGAFYMDASVVNSSKVMTHPVANGTVIADHRIIEPVKISLSVVLDRDNYTNVHGRLMASFAKGETFTISTRTKVYPSMIMSKIPEEQTPRMSDTVSMKIEFTEVMVAVARINTLPLADVSSASDASTVNRGQVTPKPSLLSRILGVGQ